MRTLRNLSLCALVVPFLAASCGSDDDGTGKAHNPDPDAATGGTGGLGGSDSGVGGTAGSTGGVAGNDGGDGSAGAPQDGWDPSFALPGINGSPTSTVFSIAITPARKVWVGGEFSQAGDLPAENVAIWNGEKWTTQGLGLSKPVAELAATPDEKMYALTEQPDSEIHYWDGTAWTAIPSVTDGSIMDIDVGPDGTLYAAGYFTTIDGVSASTVAKRTATGWVALGTGGPADGAETVEVVGSQVCVGGSANDPGFGVSCYDGTNWLPRLGNMSFGFVYSLAADSAGKLYAAGTFMLDGVDTGGGLASWNGTEWELVGGGLTGEFGQPDVQAIGFDGNKLYATGLFAFAGGLFVRNAAMWNGTKWSDLNGGLSKLFGQDFGIQPRARTLAIDDGGEVYVGGRVTFSGSTSTLRVARWDGSDWYGVDDPKAIRLGVNGPYLNAVYAASDGNIYAGGEFEHLGGDVSASNVARFDPSQGRWFPLGAGLADVRGFAERDGFVYATGGFLESGPTTTIRGVARWDGAAWKSVGGGIEGYGRTILRGPDNKLYVGGGIVQAGAVPVADIAVWDGEGWAAIGDGLGDPLAGDEVRALGFDSAGKLYAGGQFTTSGTTPVSSNVAMWDGAAWVALGDGVDASVDSIAFYQDKIVIGGTFEKSGDKDVLHVASWDASLGEWVELGGGLPPGNFQTVYVQDMAVHGTDLYVVGLIELAGSVPVSHMARFDGTTWHDVDGGVNDVAEGVTVGSDSLWVGGTFTQAGDLGSIGIARYWFQP